MAFTHTSRTLSLTLAGIALAATACADVGGGSAEKSTSTPKDQDAIVCNSIRSAIERDLKAGKSEAVAAGVEGAKSVKGCDVTDLVPAAKDATPSPN